MSLNKCMNCFLLYGPSNKIHMSCKTSKIQKIFPSSGTICSILILFSIFIISNGANEGLRVNHNSPVSRYSSNTVHSISNKYAYFISRIFNHHHETPSQTILPTKQIKQYSARPFSYKLHFRKIFYESYQKAFNIDAPYSYHSQANHLSFDFIQYIVCRRVIAKIQFAKFYVDYPLKYKVLRSYELKHRNIIKYFVSKFSEEEWKLTYFTNHPFRTIIRQYFCSKTESEYSALRTDMRSRIRRALKRRGESKTPSHITPHLKPSMSQNLDIKEPEELYLARIHNGESHTYQGNIFNYSISHRIKNISDKDVMSNATIKDQQNNSGPINFKIFPHRIGKRNANELFADETNNTLFDLLVFNSTTIEQDETDNNLTSEIGGSVNADIVRKRGEEGVIYIHGLFEQSGSECRDQPDLGLYEFRAAQLAIEHVNDRKVIPGYELRMYYNDTKCDSGVAVDAFFHSLYRQPTMMFVLGTGSSEVTERLARVVSRWNVIQVSYGAASPVLSDRKNFPMFYRTVAPDSSHNSALLAFILYHRWNTVTVLHEQGDKHALPMTKLVTDLEQVNVTVTLTKGVSDRDFKEHLQEMKDHDCRIIICSFSPSLLRKILCQVYELGMYGADYAWILVGDGKQLWQDSSSFENDCNDHQLTSAAQGLISVGSHYGVVGNMTTVSSLTTQDLFIQTEYNQDPRSSGFITHTYDAIWAIALALRQAYTDWLNTNSDVTLEDFSYDDHQMARNISDILGNLHFTGVSGPVSFHNSDRVGITAFQQKQGNNLQLIAFYYPEVTELDFQCPGCKDVIWQGGSPPIASRIIIQRIAILDRRVFICVTSLAVFGVVLALTFLSFNLYYRKFKFIKLSSPNLNNFVIVGCILVYIAVILLGLDHGTLASDDHFPIICSARAFLLSGGFSLAFGCMFIKTYRVYHIFIRTNTGIVKSKLLHDQQLLGLVSVLLLIDCVIVTLWVTIDPIERHLTNLSMQVNQQERNVVYLYMKEHCSSAHMAKWLGSLYIYKGLLLVVGCYMAWETRHVKVPALNDSQYIGMSVYNVVITSVIVVALANVIPAERYTLTFILVSTLIFVSTTTTLCILFVPKIHTILINPEDSAFVATPGVKVECKTRRFALDEPRESLYRAEVLNRALKRELLELEEEYNRLAQKIGVTPCEVRKPKLSDNQDDDSDDGLPPWLAEYKEYSPVGNDDVWYTGKPTSSASGIMASAFSAIHKVALRAAELPSTSGGQNLTRENEPVDTSKSTSYDTGCSAELRSSLPTVATTESRRKQIFSNLPKPFRSFLSDRALNKLKIPQTLRETIWDEDDYSPSMPLRRIPMFHNHLSSEPKLYSSKGQSHCNLNHVPARSLNQMNIVAGKDAALSRNTLSCDSDWMTAPLYTSTSFSTPPEDFMSSSNNGNSRRVSSEDDANYMSCDGSNGANYLSCEGSIGANYTSCEGSNSDVNYLSCTGSNSETDNLLEDSPVTEVKLISSSESSPGHSTYCEASSGSDTNPLTASNSEATLSELSVSDHNDDNKNEIMNDELIVFDDQTVSGEALKSTLVSNANCELAAATCEEVTNDNEPSSEVISSSNNNSLQRTGRREPSRNQVFRLERELILMHLDQSEAVDL